VTGIDLSQQMLALAKTMNRECEFLQDDMRSFSLYRTFDAILMDDGVSHMVTLVDLRSAFEVAWKHLNAGGVMVTGVDITKETFVQNQTVTTSANEG